MWSFYSSEVPAGCSRTPAFSTATRYDMPKKIRYDRSEWLQSLSISVQVCLVSWVSQSGIQTDLWGRLYWRSRRPAQNYARTTCNRRERWMSIECWRAERRWGFDGQIVVEHGSRRNRCHLMGRCGSKLWSMRDRCEWRMNEAPCNRDFRYQMGIRGIIYYTNTIWREVVRLSSNKKWIGRQVNQHMGKICQVFLPRARQPRMNLWN